MALFASDLARAADNKHLFILSGQSNMRQPLPDSFKHAVSQVFGADNVIVVTVAKPGQPIKRWYRAWTPPQGMKDPNLESNATLYDELIKAVNRAVDRQQLASATFIWIQGEADATNGWGRVYESSFHGVLEQLKKDLGRKEINFVLGRINDFWQTDKGVVDGDLRSPRGTAC